MASERPVKGAQPLESAIGSSTQHAAAHLIERCQSKKHPHARFGNASLRVPNSEIRTFYHATPASTMPH
jgi:hypothetical protein